MIWPKLTYHPEQYAYWSSRKRFNFLPCGRQSGKTELAMRKLVRHLPIKKEWPDPHYFFGSPTYSQAKRVAWDRILGLIPNHWIIDKSLSELIIKTIFGSTLSLYGLDKPQRIEGLIIDGGVIDENSDIRPKTFDLSILPTLVWRNGWVDFIGIPKRFGIGAVEYRDKCEKAAKGELPDSAVFQWVSEGIVPQDYLELCRQTMDERDFDEQFNATWLSASGGIFYAFDKEFNVRGCEYNPDLPLIVGSDFNVDPMCWLLCHRKGNTLEVFDEVHLRNTNTPDALDKLLSGKYGSHKGHWQMYGDASARGRHTSAYMTDYNLIASDVRLKSMGRTLHYTSSNPPMADRFAETNARICNGLGQKQVFVDPKCKYLILDLETRAYKEGTRDADDSHRDSGHMSDALGYIIHKLFPLQLSIPHSNIVTIRKGVK